MLFSSFIVFFSFFSIHSYTTKGESIFNEEISARVDDFLTNYLDLVSRSLFGPYNTLITGNIPVNLSLPDDTSKKLFYQTRLTFPESSNIYVGFQTGLFYGYLANSYHVNSANVKKRYSVYYSINHDGSRGKYMTNSTYECRTRPWYMNVINYGYVAAWTVPYISTVTGASVFNLAVPLFRNVSHPSASGFYGVMTVAIYLTEITKYLLDAYKDTDRSVFIVEKTTGQLIANTLGIPLNTKNAKGTLVTYYYIFPFSVAHYFLLYLVHLA